MSKMKWFTSFSDLILSLIFIVIIPLLPLLFEQRIDHSIKISSWAITAAIYSICIGVASRERLVFGLGVLASLCCTAGYAIAEAAPKEQWPEVEPFSFWTIVFFSVALFVERFFRHMLKAEPFFEF